MESVPDKERSFLKFGKNNCCLVNYYLDMGCGGSKSVGVEAKKPEGKEEDYLREPENDPVKYSIRVCFSA